MELPRRIEISKKVLLDCCLPNGAIVAWPSHKRYASRGTKDYYFVWVRDAAFVCLALDRLGEEKPQKKFFNWCRRTDDFKSRGLFVKRYKINGQADNHHANFLQPDQNGILLYAIWHHFIKRSNKGLDKYLDLVGRAADGLCRVWDRDHFTQVAENIWENSRVFPDVPENFTYTLAACWRGLECAYEMTGEAKYKKTGEQIKKVLADFRCDYYYKTIGRLADDHIDASALGLVFPFEFANPFHTKMRNTVSLIREILVEDGGVKRFENDIYDGWMYGDIKRNRGGGSWPVLNFWLAICMSRNGKKRKAKKYYSWVEEKTEKYIPEQIFQNCIQKSISPLAWSHAMHIIAYFELNKK